VIDFDDLMTRCLGNLEFADRILTVFQSRCETDLKELDQAIQANDIEQVERIAHRLKGACANAAAPRLASRAMDLWKVANQRKMESVPACFAALRSEWCKGAAVLQAV
jgi:HPt (histidine-containing phosphotransfer) domain-containing protein